MSSQLYAPTALSSREIVLDTSWVGLRADLYTVKQGNLISRRLMQQLVRRHVEFAVGLLW
jgi:hypothetical protein